MPDQLLLIRQSQPSRRRAGGDDQRARFVPLPVDVQPERPLRQIRLAHRPMQILGAEPLGLLLHVLHQVRPLNAFRKSGKVFDLGGNRQLPARLMPDNHQRIEIRAARVDRGGVPGAARADNDHVAHAPC